MVKDMESPNEQHDTQMKIAHVLFTDIVGYSKLPIDQQTSVLRTLQEIVRGTAEVARAQASDQLISIATGDGMALVFFNDPMAPVQCALEISRALKGRPEIQLRMGVHSGPVNQVMDVNDRVNVAGTGINIAQRIMDSGDAGHILLSRRVAEDLGQYSTWQPFLHDLKEIEVKHGVRVHVFNLYTGEAGNAALPAKIKQSKKRSRAVPAIALAALLLLVAVGTYMLLRKGGESNPNSMRAESEFKPLLQKKVDAWVESIFSAQAAGGGIKSSPSGAETTVQAWTTAQCLTAVLSAPKNLDGHVQRIKSAFDYMQKVRRTTPDEGWNLYGNQNIYTVTEINGWVTVAHVKSLESKTKIWNDVERQDILNRIVRDLDELQRRQDTTGGWRPIREDGPDFTRTYSTVVALWSLVEARKSPAVAERIGTRYDESIRGGINWLLRTYKKGQGWVQNPNRTGQQNRFDGLTAHALFVLSRAATVPELAYLKNDQTYKDARTDFINNKELATRSIEKDNSSIPDADVGFDNTEFMAEGSTFLWFPWTLLELTQLSTDESLTAEERDAAARLRREILNANFARLETYVESANLTYFTAENLFCVSQYIESLQSGGQTSP
jgi:class 3 adenylate cyclase